MDVGYGMDWTRKNGIKKFIWIFNERWDVLVWEIEGKIIIYLTAEMYNEYVRLVLFDYYTKSKIMIFLRVKF